MKGSYTRAFKVEATKAIWRRYGEEKEKKTKQQQQTPHIFYLKFTGLRWWSKPPTKEKKLVIMGDKSF